MPAPLNMIHREFAHDTRRPAAALATGMARVYQAIVTIEREELDEAVTHFHSAASAFDEAADQMDDLSLVEARWEVREPEIFAVLVERFSEISGSTPLGDRALIDVLVAEVRSLASLTGSTDRVTDTPEEQALLIGRILRQAMKAEALGLLATEISLVTSARH